MDAAAGGVLSELIGFFFFGIKEKTKTDAFLGGNGVHCFIFDWFWQESG